MYVVRERFCRWKACAERIRICTEKLRTVFDAKVLPTTAEASAGFDSHSVRARGTGTVEDAGRVINIAALVGEGGG